MMHPANCPNCDVEWLGKDVADMFEESGFTRKKSEHLAASYGWSPDNICRFSLNVIGIENPKKYDGVSYWKCLHCGCVYDRFTGDEVLRPK